MRTIIVALLIAAAAPTAYAQKPKAVETAKVMAEKAKVRADREMSAVLHFQIIEADGFTTRDPQIADVETALRGLFKFKGYRLAAEALVRVSSFSRFQQVVYADDDSTAFYLQGMTNQITAGAGGSAATVSTSVSLFVGQNVHALDTSVVVPIGQTVVVGSAKPLPKRAALILVVRPTAN